MKVGQRWHSVCTDIGLTIGAKVPDEMWAALTTVIEAVAPRRPTVLLLSEEAYVPWELATMPVPTRFVDHRVPRRAGDHRPMGAGHRPSARCRLRVSSTSTA